MVEKNWLKTLYKLYNVIYNIKYNARARVTHMRAAGGCLGGHSLRCKSTRCALCLIFGKA